MERSLADYLTGITYRAQFGDQRTAATVARCELPRLVTALRAVLDEHAPDESGRCNRCRTNRLGRAPAPCRAYLSAHLCLVATDEDSPADAEDTPVPVRRQVALGS
ncbi:hypothetical protein [Actinophytocola oryzae]|uniref:hypothetical protein n=1 Tax=Actinophytocola oryzae TaxID=502181 RepID=UPI001062B901|nr:hypothetical protein [Actinophytocola oryzae]